MMKFQKTYFNDSLFKLWVGFSLCVDMGNFPFNLELLFPTYKGNLRQSYLIYSFSPPKLIHINNIIYKVEILTKQGRSTSSGSVTGDNIP